MNAPNQTELAKVADTSQVGALALISLSPEKYAKEVYQPFNDQLATAIDSVRAVNYDIKTTAGMAVAIKCRALFRDMRVAAEKERKARKEPIIKIGKLLESGYSEVEERITPLEELFDGDIKAEEQRKEDEKQAKIEAEKARMAKIASAIEGIRERETDVIRLTKTAAEAHAEIDNLTALEITKEVFEERFDEACALKLTVLDAMLVIHDQRHDAEAAAIAAEQARIAEAARIEADRLELARQRAENERIANEQAAERKRLTDLAAAQEAAAAELRRKAEANLQAERDAQAELNRRQQAEIDRQRQELIAMQAATVKPAAIDQQAPVEDTRPVITIELEAAPELPPILQQAPPTLRLGQINERIAPLSINTDGLRQLGFEPAARDKAAMLYHESDFASIRAAMIRRLEAIEIKQAA